MFRKFAALCVLALTFAAPLVFAGCQSTTTASTVSDQERARFTTSKNLYRADLAAQNRNLR